jgi:ABC-type transporter lipoprotein component MlaA
MNKQLHESMKADLHESIKTILENMEKIQKMSNNLPIGDIYEAMHEFNLSKQTTITIFGLEA